VPTAGAPWIVSDQLLELIEPLAEEEAALSLPGLAVDQTA
jgi:hypothetical protein